MRPALTWEGGNLPSLSLPLSPWENRPGFPPRPGEEPYHNLAPLPHWGELRPELVQKKLRLREVQNLLNQMEMESPYRPKS